MGHTLCFECHLQLGNDVLTQSVLTKQLKGLWEDDLYKVKACSDGSSEEGRQLVRSYIWKDALLPCPLQKCEWAPTVSA